MNVLENLRQQFAIALEPLTEAPEEYARHVRPAQDPKFGDYQANCAMPLKKELGGNPRQIAEKIVAGLPDRSIFESVEIAGPGFINLRLTDEFLASRLSGLLADPQLGIEPVVEPKTMVIDYSSPNVAKPMHVGHLRSTIIGDAIARMHRALGWTVHADNHLGDWGTQFGMLIYGWRNETLRAQAEETSGSDLETLAKLYVEVNAQATKDPQVAEAARRETAKLHEGDPENLELWRKFMPWCLADIERIYERLDIHFDHCLGESFYQPMLEATVAELEQAGLAQSSDGAVCVFLDKDNHGTVSILSEAEVRSRRERIGEDPDGWEKRSESGDPVPFDYTAIVRKADGAFTYATSDVACVRYRAEHFGADLAVYVVDDRQSLHFQQVFEIARRLGFEDVRLVHVEFGKITGKDGRPYKTRAGGTIGLEALLDEAVTRARTVVDSASSHLPEEERASISEMVGIGAVKYADLSQNRASDYVFDWDKMISMQGNTATYLQYAYARNHGIFRKGGIDPANLASLAPAITLEHPNERALAIALLRFPESLVHAAEDFKPNLLTNYLFDLADIYSKFFDTCHVLKAETDALRHSRLVLCELTARTLRKGLQLLGIETLERM